MSSSAGDPLVDNGLGSPLCHAGAEGDLSQASQSDCQTSGFEAAPAPTGNYGFDVHINTGITDWTSDADAIFQDLLEFGWTVLEAVVHGVIVMLEWCYTLDLLNSPAMSGVASGLRQAQALFTQPWLVLALSVASVLALYHGLVRRRVAETLGQALMVLAMMVGGLWVIMNPAGTIGALGGWANQAGLGTLGAVTSGNPGHPDRTLADSMRDVFSGAIEGPWCYMEFGEVGWCDNPARRDPRLRAAGLKIAASEMEQVSCKSGSPSTPLWLDYELGLPVCVTAGSEQAKALEHSAELLRKAQSNGAIFLALAANGPERNSINKSGSLFNVLCGGSEEPCKGPTAAQAEFRTGSGTGWRFMGLFFIWLGGLGMILMLGFIALRLLAAALSSMLYLLLAPAAVLAPALGDGGRAAFRGWATRLLSAVMSKLIYSFLLGVVLLMERILTVDLTALGWFTQWLLISTMWWGAFLHRHHMLNFAQGGRSESRIRGMRLTSALMSAREMGRLGGWARRKLTPSAPSVQKRQRIAATGNKRAEAIADGQVNTSLERGYHDAQEQLRAEPQMRARQAERHEKLRDLRTKQASAERRGHQGRADRVGRAARRVEKDMQLEERKHQLARHTVTEGDRAKRQSGRLYTSAQAKERGQFLDTQAALPRQRRDYASLAGVIGHSPDEWKQLNPQARTKARDAIDRELATRGQLAGAVEDVVNRKDPSQRGLKKLKTQQRFDTALKTRVHAEGHSTPSSGDKGSALETYLQTGRAERRSAGAGESSVMRDAREVAARRKRQLGKEPKR